jgi:hypothetical protein
VAHSVPPTISTVIPQELRADAFMCESFFSK